MIGNPESAVSAVELGAELRQLREGQGLTLEALARRTSERGKIPRSTLHDAERGRRLPREETVRGFVRGCGLTEADQIARWVEARNRIEKGSSALVLIYQVERESFDSNDRARVLAIEAGGLTPKERRIALDRAIGYCIRISAPNERSAALLGIMAFLDEEQLDRLLDIAGSLSDSGNSRVLSESAKYLVGRVGRAGRPLMVKLFEISLRITDEGSRAGVLGNLAPYLESKYLDEILDSAIFQISNDYFRKDLLEKTLPHLDPDQLDKALNISRRLAIAEARSYALGSLAPYISAEQRRIAIDAARKTLAKSLRKRALLELDAEDL